LSLSANWQRRLVTFKLEFNTKGERQYGLIADAVAKVYPELVVRDQEGRIDGVRYDELAPMLLNELQQKIAAQDQHAAAPDAEINQLNAQLVEMHAALLTLQSKAQLVAQR
jgi:trimeric autotransporter adhesin